MLTVSVQNSPIEHTTRSQLCTLKRNAEAVVDYLPSPAVPFTYAAGLSDPVQVERRQPLHSRLRDAGHIEVVTRCPSPTARTGRSMRCPRRSTSRPSGISRRAIRPAPVPTEVSITERTVRATSVAGRAAIRFSRARRWTDDATGPRPLRVRRQLSRRRLPPVLGLPGAQGVVQSRPRDVRPRPPR